MSESLRNTPLIPKAGPLFVHGGDYNPDQWQEYPDILKRDIEMMKQAGWTSATIGVFAWATYEEEEGKFNFDWLDRTMDTLANAGMFAYLSTPSGAKPTWMSEKYPEIRRVGFNRQRDPSGSRHNHCLTSPIYREKVRVIDEMLAERYKSHPALALWHIGNEFGGECFCELCIKAFQDWLRERYEDDLDALNQAYWSRFWSHSVTKWEHILPFDHGVEGLQMDWRRFMVHQTVSFIQGEIDAVRKHAPNIPVTTNFMGTYPTNDYWKFEPVLDFISNDSYPAYEPHWNMWRNAASESFNCDLMRSLKKGKTWIMMESTPGPVNWHEYPLLKRPGVHRLEMMQYTAHGSDGNHYFQWRKGRGGFEKYHGAVVDHVGSTETRMFKDVVEWGAIAKKLSPVVGTSKRPEAAVVFEWESIWATDLAAGHNGHPKELKYGHSKHEGPVKDHYAGLWSNGVPVDVLPQDGDFSKYKLIVAPALYLMRKETADALKAFVANGGTLVTGYNTGIVEEHNLCHTGGWPGEGLMEVFGIWNEECDYPRGNPVNAMTHGENPLGLSGTYELNHACEMIHARGATVLATYQSDFYAGQPVLTQHTYGSGQVYYLASRPEARFFNDFYRALAKSLELERPLPVDLPEGVTVQHRTDGVRTFIFVLNFTPGEQVLPLGDIQLKSLIDGHELTGSAKLKPLHADVYERV